MPKALTQPFVISSSEWREIIQVPEVKEAWGLTAESPEEFANIVYGVKFNFTSGTPGYVGDLFILQGDVLTGDAPMMLGRYGGQLQPIY